ncbi:hypothetical protein C8R45DRAFT_923446 [Mycena sanguinolenta]|nr:hypothetical protein C8R45DRAFT_923446 [Mycena sanguinolenta]
MGLATTSAFCFACAISAPLGSSESIDTEERKGKVKAQQESWTREQAKKLITASCIDRARLVERVGFTQVMRIRRTGIRCGCRPCQPTEKWNYRVDNSSGPSRAEEATTSVTTSFDVESDVDVPTRSRTSVDRR